MDCANSCTLDFRVKELKSSYKVVFRNVPVYINISGVKLLLASIGLPGDKLLKEGKYKMKENESYEELVFVVSFRVKHANKKIVDNLLKHSIRHTKEKESCNFFSLKKNKLLKRFYNSWSEEFEVFKEKDMVPHHHLSHRTVKKMATTEEDNLLALFRSKSNDFVTKEKKKELHTNVNFYTQIANKSKSIEGKLEKIQKSFERDRKRTHYLRKNPRKFKP